MRRTATQWPPRNEKASDRQGKISHLLRIILDNCNTLNEWERSFIDKMGGLLNRRIGIEPATALSEKQARKLRSIIFKKHRDYKHAVPRLPAGVKFEDEVRRLLKSQPNPNEARNQLIEQAEAVVVDYLKWDGEDGYDGVMSATGHKYKGKEGDRFVFEISWESYEPTESEEESRWTTQLKVDPTTRRVKHYTPWRPEHEVTDEVIDPYPY